MKRHIYRIPGVRFGDARGIAVVFGLAFHRYKQLLITFQVFNNSIWR